MKCLHHSCQGESHIKINKVCQDASWSSTIDEVSVAIVSDGHGGARYFRSDVGARMAVEVTQRCVSAFVKEVDESLFVKKPFTQKQAITSEVNSENPTKDTATDKVLRQLFSSIIYLWRIKIERHAKDVPLSEQERKTVEPRYLADFEHCIGHEKTYGCTLICCVCTNSYWFAFQIGDGKCIAFDERGDWKEPIPWDTQCFLNKTTSLCDASAIEEFRYCYEGDGIFPLAVVLGSDGMDDSFGETENLVNFYVQMLKMLVSEGCDETMRTIAETLPQLSKIGSKDDMSVALVYNDKMLADKIPSLISWQINNTGKHIQQINTRIISLQETIRRIEIQGLKSQKTKIDYQYAQKDLVRAIGDKRGLVERWNKLSKELNGDNCCLWTDGTDV